MFLAGLTGFFEEKSEIMKTKAAEERAAKAKLTENLYGFRKQLALNSIQANLNRFNTIDKAVLEGKATLKDGFSKGKQEYMDYVKNYDPTKDFNPPNQDILNLVNVINDDFNTVITDDKGNRLRFKAKLDGSKSGYNKFIEENMTNYSVDKNYWKNMSPSMLAQVYSKLDKAVLAVRADEMTNKSEGYIGNNYYPNDPNEPFYAVTAGLNRYQEIGLNKQSANKIQQNRETHNTTIAKDISKSTNLNASIAQIEGKDGKVANHVAFIPKNLDVGLTLLSEKLGTTKGNAFDTFHANFYNVAGASVDDAKRVFTLSTRLAQEIPNISALSPEEGFLGDDKNVRNIHKILNSSSASFTDLTFAIAPYLKLPAEAEPFSDIKRGQKRGALIAEQVMFAKTYAGGYFAGKGAKNSEKTKAYNDAEKQYVIETQVGLKLKKFLEKRKELGSKGIATEFYAQLKTKILAVGQLAGDILGQGFFKDNKITIQQSSNLQIDDSENADNTANNDKTLTAGYLEDLKQRALNRATKDGKVDGIIGELQAMRISLAFMMARAADPSGRLSNQDIEQQFVKLGGNFTTEEGALRGIQVAIDEYEDKAKVNANIFKFVRERKLNSGELYKLIDAAFVINQINNKVEMMGSSKGKSDGSINMKETFTSGDKELTRYGSTEDPNRFIDYKLNAFVDKTGKIINE